MELITIKASKKYVTIKMPIEILSYAAEHNLDNEGVRVVDKEEFGREIARQIDALFYDSETGLTMFQKFLDEVTEQVIQSSDSIVLTNE